MTSKFARLAMALLLVVPGNGAQSVPGNAQQKRERDERERKALALVEQLRNEAQSLKLPENRLRVDLALARSVWSRDGKRARSLVRDAAAALAEVAATYDVGVRESAYDVQSPAHLRQQILEAAASRDPRLALEILRATRPASSRRQPEAEARIGMWLSVQIARNDPLEALTLAEDSLKIAVDQEAMTLLYRLQSKDKAAAERFFQDLVARLRSDDLGKSPAASGVAITLLRAWIENNRPTVEQRTTGELTVASFDEATARELSGLILRAALGDSSHAYPGQVSSILTQLKPLLGDIERLSPNQMGNLRQRIADNDRLNASQQGAYSKYSELFGGGNIEELVEAARTAPAEIADGLIAAAARKAVFAADEQVARQLIEKVADPGQRRGLTSALDHHLINRAYQANRFDEARAGISRIASNDERAMSLAQFADSIAPANRTAALEALSEAESLIAGRAENYSQLGTQVRVARSNARLDASRSLKILEGVFDRVDEIADAAFALSGFELQAQYFKQGEFVFNISTPLGNVIQESAELLGRIARDDFDRSKSVADRLDRAEMRMMALLQIAQSVLSEDAR